VFVGVALHATYDYTTLSPLGGAPADAAQTPPPVTADWIAAPPLEQVLTGPDFIHTFLSTRLSQAAIVILALVAAVRILIWQAGQRRLTPLLYAAIGAGGLLGVWLLVDTTAFVSRLGH
jgi:hypothetical protein